MIGCGQEREKFRAGEADRRGCGYAAQGEVGGDCGRKEAEPDVHFVFSRDHALNQEEWVARRRKYACWVPYLDGEPPLYKMLVKPPVVLLAWWNRKPSPRGCFPLGSSLMLRLEDREARRRNPDSIADLETRWEILYKRHLPALARNKDPVRKSWPIQLPEELAELILLNVKCVVMDQDPIYRSLHAPRLGKLRFDQLSPALTLGDAIEDGKVDLPSLYVQYIEFNLYEKMITGRLAPTPSLGGEYHSVYSEAYLTKIGGLLLRDHKHRIVELHPGENQRNHNGYLYDFQQISIPLDQSTTATK